MATFPVYETELVHLDIFNMKKFYWSAFQWLRDFNFVKDEREFEIYYNEKHIGGGMREYRIWWKPYQVLEEIDRKPFITARIDMSFLVLAMKDVEVVKDGKKFLNQKGEMTIAIKAYLDYDEDSFKKHSFMANYFRWWYVNKLRPKLLEYRSWLERRVSAFIKEIQTHLGMYSLTKQTVPWYPKA